MKTKNLNFYKCKLCGEINIFREALEEDELMACLFCGLDFSSPEEKIDLSFLENKNAMIVSTLYQYIEYLQDKLNELPNSKLIQSLEIRLDHLTKKIEILERFSKRWKEIE